MAKAAAEELYETVMSNNQVRQEWKNQNPEATEVQLVELFVARNWGKCIDFAKQSMVLMLRREDVSEQLKDQIMDALIKDNEVSATRHGYRGSMH